MGRRRQKQIVDWLRARSDKDKTAIANALREHIWPKLEAGQLAPIIDKVFDFDDVVLAHEYLESGQHFGKVLLKM